MYLYSKFIQDTKYQILSSEFCRKYDKYILAYLFLGHGARFLGGTFVS